MLMSVRVLGQLALPSSRLGVAPVLASVLLQHGDHLAADVDVGQRALDFLLVLVGDGPAGSVLLVVLLVFALAGFDHFFFLLLFRLVSGLFGGLVLLPLFLLGQLVSDHLLIGGLVVKDLLARPGHEDGEHVGIVLTFSVVLDHVVGVVKT